jgi:hypothetical protein
MNTTKTPPPQGKTKLKKNNVARPLTAIVTVFRTVKNNTYIAGICALIVIAPFIHLPVAFSSYNQIGLLGYKYLSSFFVDIGWPTATLCSGLLFKYCLRYTTNEGKDVFKFISHILLILGTYFLCYALIPVPSSKDLPLWMYMTILGIVATLLGFMLYRLPDSNAKLKGMIRFLMDLIIVKSVEKNLVKNTAQWDKEIVDVALKKLDE